MMTIPEDAEGCEDDSVFGAATFALWVLSS
jgi:hypothetical protein